MDFYNHTYRKYSSHSLNSTSTESNIGDCFMIDPSFTEDVVCVVPDLYQGEENELLIIMA